MHTVDARNRRYPETEKRLGIEVKEAHYCTDPTYHWLGATPDGDIPNDTFDNDMLAVWIGDTRSLLECKAPFFRPYDYPPIYYVIQTYVQMKVEDVSVNYLSSYWEKGESMRVRNTVVRRGVGLDHGAPRDIHDVFVQRSPTDQRHLATRVPSVTGTVEHGILGQGTHPCREKVRNMHPNMIIPDIPIECVCFDEDPCTYVNGRKIRKNIPPSDTES